MRICKPFLLLNSAKNKRTAPNKATLFNLKLEEKIPKNTYTTTLLFLKLKI